MGNHVIRCEAETPQPPLPYDSYCVILSDMFYKTMGIQCDACDEQTECIGRDATMAQVTSQARSEGWAISSAGHYCPEHRGRARKGVAK